MWFNVFMFVFTCFYKSEKKRFYVFYLQINVLTSMPRGWDEN